MMDDSDPPPQTSEDQDLVSGLEEIPQEERVRHLERIADSLEEKLEITDGTPQNTSSSA